MNVNFFDAIDKKNGHSDEKKILLLLVYWLL